MSDTDKGHAECCGASCFAEHQQDQLGKCWGKVKVIDEEHNDEDHWWIHACQGHCEMYSGDMKYRVKP